MAIDPVSGDVYGSVTDYSTFGLVEIRSAAGQLLSQFDCGVSPGVICMDVRNISTVAGAIPQSITTQGSPERFDASGRSLPLAPVVGFTLDANGRKVISLSRY